MIVGYSSSRFVATVESLYRIEFETNGEWDLLNLTLQDNVLPYKDAHASFIVTLNVKRRPHFFVMNMLLPVMALSALSSLVFILPESR